MFAISTNDYVYIIIADTRDQAISKLDLDDQEGIINIINLGPYENNKGIIHTIPNHQLFAMA